MFRYQWAEHQLKNSFFHALLRDKVSGGAADVAIPPTVVFEAGFPRAIFTYEDSTNEVRKTVDGHLLQNASLYEFFLANRAKTDIGRFPDICACLIYTLPHPESDSLSASSSSSPSSGGGIGSGGPLGHGNQLTAPVMNEALTVSALREFLLETSPHDPRRHHSLLQSAPVQDFFTVLRISWTPSASLIERRQNRFAFLDATRSPNSRMQLFDETGAGQSSRVSGTTAAQFTRVCDELAEHITICNAGANLRVAEMFLNMATGPGGRPMLLWCSNITLAPIVKSSPSSPPQQAVVATSAAAAAAAADAGGGNATTATATAMPAAASPAGPVKKSTRVRLPTSAFLAGGVQMTRGATGAIGSMLASDEEAFQRALKLSGKLERVFCQGDPLGRKPATAPSASPTASPPASSPTKSKLRQQQQQQPSPKPQHQYQQRLQSQQRQQQEDERLRQNVESLFNESWMMQVKNTPVSIPVLRERLLQQSDHIRALFSDVIYGAGNVLVLEFRKGDLSRVGSELGQQSFDDLLHHLGGYRLALKNNSSGTFVPASSPAPTTDEQQHGDATHLILENGSGVTARYLLSLLDVWLKRREEQEMVALRQRMAPRIREQAMKMALAASGVM